MRIISDLEYNIFVVFLRRNEIFDADVIKLPNLIQAVAMIFSKR